MISWSWCEFSYSVLFEKRYNYYIWFFFFLGIGLSACGYNGETDTTGDKCQNKPVKLGYIPSECTELFYEGITIDDDFNIAPTNKPTDSSKKKIIKNIRNLL